MHERGTIKSVADLVKEFRALGSPDHAHVRWLWRGQSDANWDLRPGVYRDSFPKHDEEARLGVERHLAQDFRLESAGLFEAAKTDSELYFLQQHYRIPTRLLDWSNNALAALFFAAEHSDDHDGALFFMDGYQLAPTQDPEHEYPYRGIVTSRHPGFQSAMKRIFDWQDDYAFPPLLMAIRPEQGDRRINRQRSCFTFHVPDHPTMT